MNEHLLEFLKGYLEWTENPVGHPYYSKRHGLCAMAGMIGEHIGNSKAYALHREISERLKYEAYPFSDTEPPDEQYANEYWQSTAHLNKKRLEWVRQTIKELES